jgi:AraC-like DNA-binding protein
VATQRLSTSGADETSAVLSEVYGRVATSFIDRTAGMRIERDVAGGAVLDRVLLDFGASFEVEPLETISVVRVRRGRLRVTTGRVVEAAGPGELLVVAVAGTPYAAAVDDLDEEVTALSRGVLDGVASTLRGPDTDPVRLTGQRPVSAAAAVQFNRVRAQVLQTVRDPPETLGDHATQLLRSSLGRLLASSVLAAFPSTAVTEPTSVDRHDAHPDTLRRAVAFIESNPDLDITLTDIARAAAVTPRAIQLAFRRDLDTTPMGYLRRVRLDRARADLAAAVPGDGATVTAIAARWGSARPSRFAADYRRTYGHHPTRTLQAPADWERRRTGFAFWSPMLRIRC